MKLISLIMLIAAIVFLAYALTHPETGAVFYIGSWAIGSDIWRTFYLFYTIAMVSLFVGSVYLSKKSK